VPTQTLDAGRAGARGRSDRLREVAPCGVRSNGHGERGLITVLPMEVTAVVTAVPSDSVLWSL